MPLTDEDIATAGELALGLLDKAETAQARARLADEAEFAAEHAKWTERMVASEPLAEEPPSPVLWPRIAAAISAGQRQDKETGRLRIWQGRTAASAAKAMALAACFGNNPMRPPQPNSLRYWWQR